MKLTARDIEILDVLTSKTRVLTLEQIASTWWPTSKNPRTDASKRLKMLPVTMRPTVLTTVPTDRPVLRWSPSEPSEVPFSRISYELRKRWKKPSSAVVVNHRERPPKNERQITHDAHVGSIYLQHYHHARSDDWIHEDEIPHGASERPDAVVRSGAAPGKDLLIDFGGSYSAAKLRRKHKQFKRSHYEIW